MIKLNHKDFLQDRVLKTKGIIAEAGVGWGTSAKWICEVKSDRKLYLFDTFEGLPAEKFIYIDRVTAHANRYVQPKMYANDLNLIKKILADYTNVFYIEGIIPDSFERLPLYKYGLVHLDLDLYRSTLDAIRYFWPLLESGGILLSHNYEDLPSVKLAFNVYFENFMIHETFQTYCEIIKP